MLQDSRPESGQAAFEKFINPGPQSPDHILPLREIEILRISRELQPNSSGKVSPKRVISMPMPKLGPPTDDFPTYGGADGWRRMTSDKSED